ncbi:MAG: phosphatidylglycerophosphatase [Phycisphaerae bacterium]|nr:phosphatidylglycerophosphatase [Phycisphaerae bacterium]
MSQKLTRFGWLAVSVGGLGALRPAPGTWGSIPPVAIALAAVWCFSQEQGFSDQDQTNLQLLMLAVTILGSAACWIFGRAAEAHCAGKDPSLVVADETAGQAFMLMLGAPWVAMNSSEGLLANLLLAGTAFVLFRVFDILKLPPANRIQNLKGGSGILLDDIVAGAQAWVTLKIILLWKTPTEVIDCLGLTS